MSKLYFGINNSIITLTLLLFVISGLSACSAVNSVTNKVTGKKAPARYENNQSVKDLEFPPDLTAPEFDKAFVIPSGTVSAVSMKKNMPVPTQAVTVGEKSRSTTLSSLKKQGSETLLQINDKYEKALLLTEIMLERMHFKVVDKMLATGEMNVRYQGANPALVKNGNYRISVINAQGVPLVRVTKNEGTVLSAKEHARIIMLLNNEFNK